MQDWLPSRSKHDDLPIEQYNFAKSPLSFEQALAVWTGHWGQRQCLKFFSFD
jgi:hypothetical protein